MLTDDGQCTRVHVRMGDPEGRHSPSRGRPLADWRRRERRLGVSRLISEGRRRCRRAGEEGTRTSGKASRSGGLDAVAAREGVSFHARTASVDGQIVAAADRAERRRHRSRLAAALYRPTAQRGDRLAAKRLRSDIGRRMGSGSWRVGETGASNRAFRRGRELTTSRELSAGVNSLLGSDSTPAIEGSLRLTGRIGRRMRSRY